MKTACAVAAAILLAGCVPMKELRDGPERARLVEAAQRYCAAEASADPHDTAPLFVASIRELLDRLPGGVPPSGGGPSADPSECEPGRAWYHGGSRLFVDVRRAGGTERLDFWRGTMPLIHDVIYDKPGQVAGQKVRTLRHELMLLPPPPVAHVPDLECYPGNYHFAFLDTDTQIYRQGATVKVTPTVDISPAGTRPVPVRCTSDWSVSGPATLSTDRTTLAIAPDAPVGSMVTVTFRHADKPVTARFQVIGRDELVLTGRWSQRAVEGCEIPDPVRELEFFPGGRFAVTFTPFETYRDYWGTYTFDPAIGRVTLKAEGGNYVPDALDLEGEARLDAGALVLSGVFLGSKTGPPQSGCTYRF